MILKFFAAVLLILSIFSLAVEGVNGNDDEKSNVTTGIKLHDHTTFNALSSSTSACSFTASKPPGNDVVGDKQTVKLELRRRTSDHHRNSFVGSATHDLSRIQTLHKRITQKKNLNAVSRLSKQPKKPTKDVVASPAPPPENGFSGQLVATLASGVSLGSGEYFMDVFIGTPPKHFSLILDTGSDLNWIQCEPCYDCFEQNGPYYDPKQSTSYRNVNCNDQRCQLVSSPDPPRNCSSENQKCPYFYWYGDSSNTTGDFALETFTVNLTSMAGNSEFQKVQNVMFGCGHWNRGLFHGAAGLLGLGRGPLSFSSQLQSLYGHSFSYCLVDRNSGTNVSSKLIFGQDKELLNHPQLNFTALVAGKENPVDTFYYVQIKSVVVGGEVLNIPESTWHVSSDDSGGTIVDSGTTLSYFADPAYRIIKDAFEKKVKGYPRMKDFPILEPCYNVSGVENPRLPEFGILFEDGGVWNFPAENYFIRVEEEVMCLAMLGTPGSGMSIIGNYQQQNFHILYDTKNSRIGYAPMRCSHV